MSIKRSVILLTLVNLLASGAGFIREMAMAYYFGTSAAADAFAVVIFYIDSVTVVFQYGLASYMLVPLVTRLINDSQSQEGFRLLESIMLWLTLVVAPLMLAGWLCPDWLAKVLVPAFSDTQNRYFAGLIGITSISLFFVMLSSVISGFLRAYADYYTAVNGRAVFSLVVAFLLVTGSPFFGVRAGVVGILAGAGIQLLLILYALRKLGWLPKRPQFRNPYLTQAFHIGLPSTLAVVITNLVMGGAQRSIASGLPEGALASVGYAFRTLSLVSGLTLSLITVALTELSVHFHQENGFGVKAHRLLADSIRTGMFLLIPLSFLLFVLSEPLVALLFQRGQYDSQSLHVTVECLRWFVLCIIPGMILGHLQGVVCPVILRPWRVLAICIVQMIITIALTFLLIDSLGAKAVPVAILGGVWAGVAAGAIAVWDILDLKFYLGIIGYSVRILIISSLALIILLWVVPMHTPASRWTPLAAIEAMFKPTLIFGVIFAVSSILSRDPNMLSLVNKAKVGWRRLFDGEYFGNK